MFRTLFEIVAWVVLPDHMHCIWKLSEGDADYATRWRLIKTHFSKALAVNEYRSPSRIKNAERGIWRKLNGFNYFCSAGSV